MAAAGPSRGYFTEWSPDGSKVSISFIARAAATLRCMHVQLQCGRSESEFLTTFEASDAEGVISPSGSLHPSRRRFPAQSASDHGVREARRVEVGAAGRRDGSVPQ